MKIKTLIIFLVIVSRLGAQDIVRLSLKCTSIPNQQPYPNLYIQIDSQQVQSNSNGFLNVFIKSGIHFLYISENKNFESYLLKEELIITKDTFIELNIPKIEDFTSVKIKANNPIFNEKSDRITISNATIQTLSLPLSTNDPIHLLKLLPGISTSQEMNNNLNIRGASAYNTIFYMDNLPVPNLTHSFGLFSFFDLNTIRLIDYMNKNISSEYGSRGSGFIKFYLKDPLLNKNTSELNINPFFISGNLNLKLIEDKLGVFVNYRKSILSNSYNIVLPLFSDFSDLLVKLKYKVNAQSDLKVIFMQSDDKSNNNIESGLSIPDSFSWNFKVASIEYTHISKKGFHNNLSVFYKSQYNSGENNSQNLGRFTDNFNEYNAKYFFTKKISKKYFLKNGFEYQNHEHTYKNDSIISERKAINIASLFSDNSFDYKNLKFFGNFRLSSFMELKKVYLEKRVGIEYYFKRLSIYAELNDFVNNINAVSNNIFPIPSDYRFLPNKEFLPLRTQEKLIGVRGNTRKISFQTNLYYRNFINSLDYVKLYSENQNNNSNIAKTKHYSYGLEGILTAQFSKNYNCNISYTYSKSILQSYLINNGKSYVSNYDRPHIVNILNSFKYRRLNITATFALQSGRPASVPLYFAFGNRLIYSDRNEYRLKTFHKLDIGMQYSFKNKGAVKQFINFNIYNIYNRKNVYAVVYASSDFFSKIELKYLTAFPILPSFSYSIKF